MKRLLGCLLLVCATGHAQVLDAPQPLQRAPAASYGALDAAETPMMALPSSAGTLAEWYAAQKRPPLVVYFDKKLNQLPPGWRGERRLLIEDASVAAGKEETRRTTIGVQRNTTVEAEQVSQFARMFQLSLQQELKRQTFHVLDSTYLHRRMAASNRSESKDIEYDSLDKSARLIFEVELLVVGGECELVGALKDVRSGDIVATVRLPVEGLDSPASLDRASRTLVQHLLRYKV